MVELKKANPFDYIRFVLSALLLTFSAICTTYAIIMQKTHFWEAVPGWAALLLFIIDLFWLGVVEGLQIALVELKRQHPDAYKKTHPAAYRLGQVASKGDNTERFLMGRQVFVVVLVFFAAKLTTLHLPDGHSFLFPVPKWVQAAFFETGLLACLVVVILAQLMPQIVAAKYPVHFLQIFIMKPAYYACIFLEITGLTHICWVLSAAMSKVMGMRDDSTTINPNDIDNAAEVLERVDSSLNTIESGNSTGSSSVTDTSKEVKYAPMHQEQFSRFTSLVQKINEQTNPDTLRVLRHFLDTHPEKFSKFPSVIGDKMYPAPQAIAEEFRKEDYEVPRFLTDISDPNHVPPHIVACELLAHNRQLEEEINMLRTKLSYM